MQTKSFPTTSFTRHSSTPPKTPPQHKIETKKEIRKTKMNSKVKFVAIFVAIVMAIGEVEVAKAVTCNPLQLSPCASAIMSAGSRPSAVCCGKIKEQRPCLCQYMKNPNLQKFINSPGAKKVAASCGTPFPNC